MERLGDPDNPQLLALQRRSAGDVRADMLTRCTGHEPDESRPKRQCSCNWSRLNVTHGGLDDADKRWREQQNSVRVETVCWAHNLISADGEQLTGPQRASLQRMREAIVDEWGGRAVALLRRE